jgi:hypothetical protein
MSSIIIIIIKFLMRMVKEQINPNINVKIYK